MDGVDSNGRRAIVNSSRGIIYASTGSDFRRPRARPGKRRGCGMPSTGYWDSRGPGMALTLRVGDVVRMKKAHPCGGYHWRVGRLGRTLD